MFSWQMDILIMTFNFLYSVSATRLICQYLGLQSFHILFSDFVKILKYWHTVQNIYKYLNMKFLSKHYTWDENNTGIGSRMPVPMRTRIVWKQMNLSVTWHHMSFEMTYRDVSTVIKTCFPKNTDIWEEIALN